MPEHSTAELHPGAQRDDELHLRIMIESMVRAGYSEPAITQAVESSTGAEHDDRPASFLRRLKAVFGS